MLEILGSQPVTSDVTEMLAKLSVPFFVVDAYTIRFYALVVVGEELFAFNEYGQLDFSRMQAKIAVSGLLAELFLIYE
ncbi:hypothetical protein HDU86_003278, partial [Geranomyces michiganensis]